MSTRLKTFWHHHHTIITWIVLVVVVGFFLFEVSIRLLTPDAVRYNVQVSTNGGPAITRTGTISDPETIARWRAAVTETPSGHLLIGTMFRQDNCAPLSYETVSYVFLWHGIAIEVVSSLSVCTGEYTISSGGLPDPRTYFVTQLVQP